MKKLLFISLLLIAVNSFSQTTFLLEATGSTHGTPAAFSTWTSSGSAINSSAYKTGFKQSTTLANTTIAVNNSSATASTCFGQFISPALNAQTINGTVTSYIRASIANATGATTQACIEILVINRAGVVVATLLAITGNGGNLTTTLTSYQVTNAVALSSYACANGDRLVIRWGIKRSVGTTARNGTLDFGSNSATNISAAASTTANNPVVTFSSNITFYQGG